MKQHEADADFQATHYRAERFVRRMLTHPAPSVVRKEGYSGDQDHPCTSLKEYRQQHHKREARRYGEDVAEYLQYRQQQSGWPEASPGFLRGLGRTTSQFT